MEKTKETKVKNTEKLSNVIEFISENDAKEFKRIATGRKFCKRGERIIDICNEEIERYKYNNSSNIFVKIFKYHKFQKNKGCMIENRLSSNIRGIAQCCINNANVEDEFLDIKVEDLVKQVKEIILEKVEKYQKQENKIETKNSANTEKNQAEVNNGIANEIQEA